MLHSNSAQPTTSNPKTGKNDKETVIEELLLGQYIPLHYHFNMLQDEDRVNGFHNAIEKVVQPGMRVLELGGGTGILSWKAAMQGADVICVERNPALVRNAERFLKQNRNGHRVKVVQADAREYLPEEPVDVVICEMLHVGLLREKQTEVIECFKRRYIDAHGGTLPIFIPEATTMLVQPIEQDFDFRGYYAPLPMFQAPAQTDPRTIELGEPVSYCNLFYDQPIPSVFNGSVRCQIKQSGVLNALRFLTQNLLTILPNQSYIPWSNHFMVLPLAQPIDVSTGQFLDVSFQYQAGGRIEEVSESMQVSLHREREALAPA